MSIKSPTKRAHLYVLDDEGNPQPVYDPVDRCIAKDQVGPYRVITIFLGPDPDGVPFRDPPRLWETTRFICDTWRTDGQWRYTSKAAAIHGHQMILEATRRLVERGQP